MASKQAAQAKQAQRQALHMLDRAAILAANDKRIDRVDVPEWGGFVFAKTMSGKERDLYEKSVTVANKDGELEFNFDNVRAKLLVRTICDEHGNLLFNEEDIEALAEKSAKAVDRCFAAAQRINGISQEDVQALAKN